MHGNSCVLPLLLFVSLCCQADFSDQCPQQCVCKWANGKREADCAGANFQAVPMHLHHEIQILRMTGNYVRRLGKEVFKSAGLLNLQRIFMNGCHVQEIHVDAFKDLKILVELDLSHNNLSELHPRTFTGNDRLQTLDLSHNQISTLHPFQFPPLKHLKTVDMSYNRLASVDRNTFAHLGNSVESVAVDNNALRTIREEVFLPLTNLKSLQLHSNPWTCDCHLKSFRDWVTERGLVNYPTSCSDPERLAGKPWADVEAGALACKPEIRVPQSVVFSEPGSNVTLSCFIIGSPMPNAKWVLKGRIVNNNTVPAGGSALDGQLFVITEEGGLERWFNLTILNVGDEQEDDYTCVAVNAGGVMEENISLTFDTPKPVGLPGGQKEESSLAIIIGVAAAAFFFLLLLFILLCCCCCRRQRIKGGHNGSNPSSASRTPERHGSVIGFADSNSSQRLMQHQQHPHQHHHHHYQQQIPDFNSAISPPQSPTNQEMIPPASDVVLVRQPSLTSSSSNRHFSGIPLQPHELQEQQQQVELKDLSPTARLQPKPMMVSSNGVDQFHTNLVPADSEHFPDLLGHTNQRPYQQPPAVLSPTKDNNNKSHQPMRQPLNPAALVVPPAPPAQFPHQFPHLIHSSRSAKGSQSPGADPQPLLSPPAQFGHNTLVMDSRPGGKIRANSMDMTSSYVTLPRQRPLMPKGSGQHVDWESFVRKNGGKPVPNSNTSPSNSSTTSNSSSSRGPPLYDGVGPRTTATGALANRYPTILEEPSATNVKTVRSVSSPHILQQPGMRDSSGSEVTLPEIGSYCEPFGKAVPPPPLPPSVKHHSSRSRNRDSIVSADSDMGGMLASNSSTSSKNDCPLHKHNVKEQPKQLKGILKNRPKTMPKPRNAAAALDV